MTTVREKCTRGGKRCPFPALGDGMFSVMAKAGFADAYCLHFQTSARIRADTANALQKYSLGSIVNLCFMPLSR